MKFLVLTAIFAAAFAAPADEVEKAEVEIEKAQMPFFPPMLGLLGMGMGGMGGMYPGMMQGQGGYDQQYPIDYSQSCSNNCNCGQVCVPWVPCGCRCPPPCPPVTTPPPPLCSNGAPDSTFPNCCLNGVVNNIYCCANGAQNPSCTFPTNPPPTVGPTTEAPCNGGGCGCQPCMPCRPCMIWWMCSPCNCNNGCQTTPTPITTPKPLCSNGVHDVFFPYCCTNGAHNQYCCTNGASNPSCTLPSPPITVEPPTTPGTNCPCQCPVCIPWFPCQPCSCNNACQNNANNPVVIQEEQKKPESGDDWWNGEETWKKDDKWDRY